MISVQTQKNRKEVKRILREGSGKIAPLWSLENFVAVNPYLGMSNMKFSNAMDFLEKTAQTDSTLPTQFYLEAFRQGRLSKGDIAKALEQENFGIWTDVEAFIADLRTDEVSAEQLQLHTLVDVASEINGKKWRRFMVDRISFWAAAHFDSKQATWDTSDNDHTSLFEAWKQEAEVDFSPETMGLKGFRRFIQNLPNDHLEAASLALEQLDIPESILGHYLNSLLMKMNGWAGFAARMDWDAGLAGKESQALEEFLAIMLVWEMSLKELLGYSNLDQAWDQARKEAVIGITTNEISEKLARQLVLQEAFDIANQRAIIEKIDNQKPIISDRKKPKAQAIFCIDVRSEVIRRNLEAADHEIKTLGFAGFFAFPIKYLPIAHNEGVNQCPVLLTTSHTVKEQIGNPELEERTIGRRTLKQHVLKALKSFKLGAISCFSFVSPLGIYFLPKLFTDSFGWTRPMAHPDEAGLSREEVAKKGIRLDGDNLSKDLTGIPMADRLKMATSALKAMSLTDNFAPIVLIVGHGSSTVNNPHGTGLDCGACGGHTGEANAKVAAAVLNDPKVREGLKDAGIHVPQDTRFLPALHDTTTDEVKIFYQNDIDISNEKNLVDLKYALKVAGESARMERGVRMNIRNGNIGNQVIQRSKDWSQVRPEWGLAGCSSFIVAPRERTSQLDFGGKAFMHNYSWRKDTDFSVLELIMSAPMVVTSWINLQYYASTVDNKKFGSGNKTLHNVVGGLGVLEGFAGDLRVGLPFQSVHDGDKYQHEPQRLNVIIEAPVDEMSKILQKHESIRQLCDNNWIYLFAINDEGKVAYKYIGDLEWELI